MELLTLGRAGQTGRPTTLSRHRRIAMKITNGITLPLIGLLGLSVAYTQPAPPESEMLIERDVRVPTRAGFEVAVNVYRPNRTGRFPVIISMGPYGKDDLPAEYDGTFSNGQILVSEYTAFETPDPGYWTHFDYVVIAADSPGAMSSGGDLELLRSIEANAFYDVIEWAGVQSWSNGNVGLNGVSYFAVSQWPVAGLNPPHLKAIMPVEGLTDVYRDTIRHGGVPVVFADPWMNFRIRPAMNPEAQLINDFAEAAQERPLFDDFWESHVPRLADITVPAYIIASWPDHGLHTRGTLIGFEDIASEDKWLEVHGRKKWEYYYSRDSLERQKRFFDHFLKGADNGMPEVPRVRYERRNAFYDGEVLHADTWPLRDVEHRRFYLGGAGTLHREPDSDAALLRYDSTGRDDQLAFRHTFRERTEITGSARLRAWVTTDVAEDMDLFVGLSKLDRNGNEVFMAGYNDVEDGHLASGWLRVSHRELDEERSTENRPFLRHERLLKLEPGQPVPVDVEILPSSTLFREGESIVLRIQGTELPGAGDIEHWDSVNVGYHIVHAGGEYESYLVLPVVPSGE